VELRLALTPEAVVVEIADDGVGLPEEVNPPPGHMGLLNMRERASLLGGRCTITPGPQGRGTLVRAQLPLPAGEPGATLAG
jgi:signal transduction histidine kinase